MSIIIVVTIVMNATGYARKARIEQFELDEDFQPYHPPFPDRGHYNVI